jgi:hypothetical protein
MDNWSGETCSEFDPCDPSPCENDGICSETGNVFECNCVNGYQGKTCKTEACTPSPCGDGICSLTDTGYVCNCSNTVLFGDNCEIGTTCDDIDCGENGQEITTVSGCECECNYGYIGSLCETTIPTEAGDPCIDDSVCTETGQICVVIQVRLMKITGFERSQFILSNILFPNSSQKRLLSLYREFESH